MNKEEVNKSIEETLSITERIGRVELKNTLCYKIKNRISIDEPQAQKVKNNIFIFSPAFKAVLAVIIILLNILTVYFALNFKSAASTDKNAAVKQMSAEYFNYNSNNY